jgi:hypothetical protein
LDKRGAHWERFDHEIKSVGSEREALQKGYFGAKDGHFRSLQILLGAQINGECKVMAAHFRASFPTWNAAVPPFPTDSFYGTSCRFRVRSLAEAHHVGRVDRARGGL